MSEQYLTIAEIEAKCPNQWVLLGNPTLTRLHEVRGGHVLFHTADRLELYRWFEALPDDPAMREFASWYTGPRDAVEVELEQQRAA